MVKQIRVTNKKKRKKTQMPQPEKETNRKLQIIFSALKHLQTSHMCNTTTQHCTYRSVLTCVIKSNSRETSQSDPRWLLLKQRLCSARTMHPTCEQEWSYLPLTDNKEVDKTLSTHTHTHTRSCSQSYTHFINGTFVLSRRLQHESARQLTNIIGWGSIV